MLISVVTYTFPAERADEAARLLGALRDASRAEPGCRGYDVARSDDDPGVFVLYETWNDQAALDAHYQTEHFRRLGVNGIRILAQSRVAHRCSPLP
ncbi:MAG: putative quinol monooxygenase [Candidatus Velthaea sp.]|jgi:quinol monooxygenase YgiN